MKNIIRLAIAYIRYYKKQAAALLMGVVLSAALFTGIGSLFQSGRMAALENARLEYGDWHYNTRGDFSSEEEFIKKLQGKGYEVEKYGLEMNTVLILLFLEKHMIFGSLFMQTKGIWI